MFSNTKIGIDLGTANILVHSSKGVILNEPSIVAIDTQTNDVIAVGTEAKQMVGRTPKHITAIRPLKEGVIADYDITTQMLKQILAKASKKMGSSIRKPVVIVCIPAGSTDVERRAIKDAITSYGAKEVHLIEEAVAAAIGSDLPVAEPVANVIVDIGGGTSEVGIISFGGIVTSNAIRSGGDHMDIDIIQYIRKKHNILIGERTAEEIKMTIGYALPDHTEEHMEVRGRDMVTGLPKTISISSYEIQTALQPLLDNLLEIIQVTLEDCPPELSGDIVDFGVVLAGGGSLLNGMQEWLSNKLSVPVHMAPNPLEAVAIGTGRSLSMIEKLQKPGK